MNEFAERKKIIFSDYWSDAKIENCIKIGTLKKGQFFANNYKEGFVFMGEDDASDIKSVFIEGIKNLNRAVHLDIVAVRILPEQQWTCPLSYVSRDKLKFSDLEMDKNKNEIQKKEKVPTGIVVGIITRNWRQYCGVLRPPSAETTSQYLFVAEERKIPYVKIETTEGEWPLNEKLLVAIDKWRRDSRYPEGHVERKLGKVGKIQIENEVLLLEQEINFEPFTEAVEQCLPELPWEISKNDLALRKDFRDYPTCSIDPLGCNDIDDTIHCKQLENDKFEIGVHIADVSHFVKPATELDSVAASRGTTIYLVDTRVDMLPDLLSSNLCSLKENEERFAFSVIWEMTQEAKILKSSFFKSVIKSKAALSYGEAQLRIDDLSLNDEITTSLRFLNKLSKVLKKQRMDKGAILSVSTEINFVINQETHEPIGVEKKELNETNSLIEEFMLLANVTVAEEIYKKFPECSILRKHPPPATSDFNPLIKAGFFKGFKVEVNSGKALAKSLDAAIIPEDPYFNTLMRKVAKSCMTKALYVSSGMLHVSDFSHYGLAVPIYTHFTSPIRRYADVNVHRLLSVTIGADVPYPSLVDKNKTQELCNNLNLLCKRANYCQRTSVNLCMQMYLKDKYVEENGFIIFIRENAVIVFIPYFDLECTLYLSSCKNPDNKAHFSYNEELCTQSASGITLCLFDPVIVQLYIDTSNIQRQRIMLKLVKPVIPGFSVPPITEETPLKKQKTLEGTAVLPAAPGAPSPQLGDNQQGAIMMAYELCLDKFNSDKIFNFLCLYGNILRIKFLKSKESCAMIQMGNAISVERAVSNLNGALCFNSTLQLGFSKQEFVYDSSETFTLPDGTPSFKDYRSNPNNRFSNNEDARNKINPPSKVLEFFNAPFGISEDEMKKVFEDNVSSLPSSVKFFTSKNKSEKCSGLIEFTTVKQSLEALILCNHVPIKNPSGKSYILKLCFSSTNREDDVAYGGTKD